MRLPRAPAEYSMADQATLRSQLEQNDSANFKKGQDVLLVQGERLILGSVSGLTAHAGGGQANALALAHEINHITVVATTADSVALPPAVAGRRITVINRGANACQVFGISPDTVNGAATATGVSQASNVVVTYSCPVAGQWFA